jgi:putative membrane protein (TIGR04086 family)
MKSMFFAHIRGAIYALALTVAGIFAFAFLVQYIGLGGGAVMGITQALKAVSIFVGVWVIAKNAAKHAWLHGGILGVVYTALIFVILSVIDGGFSITDGFIFEAAFAAILGVISAMLLRLRKRA